MSMFVRKSIVALVLVLSFVSRAALAQPCEPEWWDQFDASEFNGIVYALTVFDDDGSGPNPPTLYAAGSFTNAGGVPAGRIAKWNGSSWSPLGQGMNATVFALAVYDADGGGPYPPALYAGGSFTVAGDTTVNRIARWNGTSWSRVGNGVSSTVFALTVFDEDNDGPLLPALHAGGLFITAGGTGANRIAKWDGSAWSPLLDGVDNYVDALAVYDEDGNGPTSPALYVGGGFTAADGLTANRIAKWNGSFWSPLETETNENGLDAAVYALAVFDDDGDDPNSDPEALYVGGAFATAGAVTANHIAKWDGKDWFAVDSGTNAPVWAMTVFDEDDSGPGAPALFAGGYFTTAGGISANRIVKWDGTSWSALGDGVNDGVRSLAIFDDDGTELATAPPALFVGGQFTIAGGLPSGRIAKWGCPPPPPSPPEIIAQPESQTICEGQGATFSVSATGTPPLQYQWRHNGADLAGATSPSYAIAAATTDDAGEYDVVVTNDLGSVTSDPATLTVNTGVTITEQPQPQAVCADGAVTFTVNVDGTEPVDYQWRHDGQPIDGATEASYSIEPVTVEDAGGYDVVVSNICSSATSVQAMLTVNTAPTITQQPEPQTVCTGGAVTFAVTAEGTQPLEYQWHHDGQPIDGATESSYVIDPVTIEDAGEYDVVVTNACGWDTSDMAMLTVNVGPSIVEPPQSQQACEGDGVTFTVAADGTEPLDYQWRHDGQPIDGATEPSHTIDLVTLDDAGDYDVVVANLCGTATSDPAALTVEVGPSITEQPQSQGACEGDAVGFTVTAGGSEPLEYQWRKNGQPIDGAVESSYTIDPVTLDDAGDYDVVVTNLCGSAMSDLAALSVDIGPIITAQPQPQEVCQGDAATFTVVADGTQPLEYQWQHDGQPIDGAVESSYTIDPVTSEDSGEYEVVVTNVCGAVTSQPATLTVDTGPTITTNPASQGACAGDVVTFEVAAEGSEPLGYQWRRDSQPIDGAIEASYSIDPVAVEDAAEYDAIVTNPCGEVTSAPATLTVDVGPAIYGQPQPQEACEGDAATFTVAADGTEPLEYQWRRDGEPIDGATETSYTVDPVTIDDAADYDVVVTNVCGSLTSDPAALTVHTGPTISEQPESEAVCQGDAVLFTVVADGMPPLEYQWRKDGAAIAGATESSYTIDPVDPNDVGEYDVVVTTACGSITSELATLTVDLGVTITEQPQPEALCAGGAATFSVTAEGTEPLEYHWRHEGEPIDGATEASYTIDPVMLDDGGEYDVVVSNPCGPVTSAAATLTVDTGPAITQQPEPQAACQDGTATFTVTAAGTEPLEYQWRRDGVPIDGATEPSYTIDPVTADAAGEYDVVVTNLCGANTSDPAALTVESGPSISAHPEPQSACEDAGVTFTVTAYGTEPLEYQWRRGGVPIDGAIEAVYAITSVAPGDAGDYDVVVTNACGSVTSSPAALTVNMGPVITRQPEPQAACAGGVATFSVTANGTAPLEYQWRRDGQPIAGATERSLTVDPVVSSAAGDYDVLVSNPCGATASGAARLTVDAGPIITGQPQSQSVCEGDAVTFTVTAEGTDPLVYQWRKDGEPIDEATGPTFAIAAARLADAGDYEAAVLNACGTVTSETAVLTVDRCIDAPDQPSAPSPKSGATAVSIDADLSWAEAAGADLYDVYFGATDPPALAGNTTAVSWTLATLSYDATYYWQVVAVNEAGETAGPVWSFTTVSAPTDDADSEQPETEDDQPPDAPDSNQPEETLSEEVMPPGCGAGACGAGYFGTMPLTLLCLCGMKRRLRRQPVR
jgi:hypothetical protein